MRIRNLPQNIHSFILNSNLLALTLAPMWLGASIFLIWLGLSLEGYRNSQILHLCLSLVFFCFGISGIPGIVRKESLLGGRYAKGTSAVIWGSSCLILCWALAF